MDRQADLGDHRVLADLLDRLLALPRIADDALAEAEADAAPRIQRFERGLEAAREEVRRSERELEEASDEDSRICEDELEAARANIARMETAADDLEAALQRYRRAARQLRSLDRETLAPARDFLTERLRALESYAGLRPGGGSGRDVSRAAASTVALKEDAPPIRSSIATALPPLPDGYGWIKIESLPFNPRLDWGHGHDRSRLEAAMKTFARDLLPRLRVDAADPDSLRAIDRANGRADCTPVHPESLVNVRAMLFSTDAIAVSALPGGRFDVSSGDHLIEVARSLGWTHIPARLLGGSR